MILVTENIPTVFFTGTDQEYRRGRKWSFSFSTLGTELTNIFLKSDSLPQLVALVVSSPCRDEIDPNKNLEKQKTMECHPDKTGETLHFKR